MTAELLYADLDSDPHYGWDQVESYGEPFDAFIATLDAEGTSCTVCETGVGSSLHDDFTDDGHRMRARWTWMSLVVEAGEVLPLCEDCALILLPPVTPSEG